MIGHPWWPTKAELLAALRSCEEAVTRLRTLPAVAFETRCYQDGWTGREVLAHLAGHEWTYRRLLDVAREVVARRLAGEPPDIRVAPPVASGPAPAGGGGEVLERYSEHQVTRRAGASAADLLAEFQRNRAATIAAVVAADECLLRVPVRAADGTAGPLGAVLYAGAVCHVLRHVADIGRPAG
ncbi:MAG TPA: hypothetical protein VIO14_05785 [Dehalococcoidia bacterium]